jgi:ketosteroid isomerase-like protein
MVSVVSPPGDQAAAVRKQAAEYEAALLNKDKAALDGLLHPDYQLRSGPDLFGGGKAEAVALAMATSRTFTSLTTKGVRIRVFGDAAIESGFLSACLKGNNTWEGLPCTRIWVQQGKRWWLAHEQY